MTRWFLRRAKMILHFLFLTSWRCTVLLFSLFLCLKRIFILTYVSVSTSVSLHQISWSLEGFDCFLIVAIITTDFNKCSVTAWKMHQLKGIVPHFGKFTCCCNSSSDGDNGNFQCRLSWDASCSVNQTEVERCRFLRPSKLIKHTIQQLWNGRVGKLQLAHPPYHQILM